MSQRAKQWTYHLSVAVLAIGMVVVFNFLVCHPVDFVRTNTKPAEWKTYANTKFGFSVEIPSTWSIREDAQGVELYDAETRRYISVKALAEESSLLNIPTDEYTIERSVLRHTYVCDTIREPQRVVTKSGLTGYMIAPPLRNDVDRSQINAPWADRCDASTLSLTYFPVQFAGDIYASFVEFLSTGPSDAVYEHMTQSYRHLFKTLRQGELMRMHLIDTSETPSPAVAYVGETRGFYVDFDADGTDELLIAGMPRNMEDTKERCFFRVLKKQGDQWVWAFERKYSENSFHSSDIKIVNLDNRFGPDVFLRFVEHGNPWGKNSTVIIFWDGDKFRGADFGAFGDARDLNGDGTDEVIHTTNSYFSQGAIASWYDVYTYDKGEFIEVNSRFPEFYKNTVLPKYRDQYETVQGELALTRVEQFKGPARQLMFRLSRYIDMSTDISEGRPARERW